MVITIDGIKCQAHKGEYILDIAKRNNIHIPTLCHSDALPGQGNCRLCIVEVIEKGKKKVVTSCTFPVTGEIEVMTNSEKIRDIRKTLVRLLSARAPKNEYIDKLRQEYDIPPETRLKTDDNEDCILCGLCVRACEEMGIYAISTVNRGITKKVSTPFDEASDVCIGCGACAYVCPTSAIKVLDEGGKRHLWNKTFELIKCVKCGGYFTTREHFEYMKGKFAAEGTEITEPLCDKCKKKTLGENMAKTYK
ncbi:MAG: bidirectional [NiFe] hydrogenase diaphorase subunit [Thermoanaerobacteraceae bacterium]|jgi:NADH dehydrogenase/NADH:ubiquinone oxidoreductase subunit G|nr:bidirectional [NiFe] hydrogenase diaphorase subunit [Thermoanaerobacteraceae bacterium]